MTSTAFRKHFTAKELFELENAGPCVFAASKGKELVLPEEVFVDSTKIKWTASTADGEYYGESPQDTSDRDMAGKIALAMIYNLSGNREERAGEK